MYRLFKKNSPPTPPDTSLPLSEPKIYSKGFAGFLPICIQGAEKTNIKRLKNVGAVGWEAEGKHSIVGADFNHMDVIVRFIAVKQ